MPETYEEAATRYRAAGHPEAAAAIEELVGWTRDEVRRMVEDDGRTMKEACAALRLQLPGMVETVNGTAAAMREARKG